MILAHDGQGTSLPASTVSKVLAINEALVTLMAPEPSLVSPDEPVNLTMANDKPTGIIKQILQFIEDLFVA